MSNRYSNKKKKENASIKAMFSVVCLCIIALGMIAYFSSNSSNKNTVNENTTITEATEVQKAVTVTETTTKKPAVTTTKKKKTELSTMAADDENTPYKSDYGYPLSEAVLKGYSEELVLDKTMGDYRAHAGVDFKGEKGAQIKAINKGIVVNVYKDSLYGGVIDIDHGGKLVATYSGVDNAKVKIGDSVEKGEILGTLGKVPAEVSDGYHLHLETRLDSKLVNPLDVMGKTE